VTFFPSVGNHDTYPINQFRGPPYDHPIYQGLANAWKRWLPFSAINTMSYGGYYSAEIVPGLRVISIQTMYGNGGDQGDYWLLLNGTSDLARQLVWLEETLKESSSNGEKVYIIGHMSPGNGGMLNSYATMIHRIVDKYSNSVAALFFGHTHHDHFEITYDFATNKIPTHISFIAPSVTTQTFINPSFRQYIYDRKTFNVVDYNQFTANLLLSNTNKDINWEKIYSPREDYQMPSLSPSSYQDLVYRFSKNQTLFNLYYYHRYTEIPQSPCVSTCVQSELCSLTSCTQDLYQQCIG